MPILSFQALQPSSSSPSPKQPSPPQVNLVLTLVRDVTLGPLLLILLAAFLLLQLVYSALIAIALTVDHGEFEKGVKECVTLSGGPLPPIRIVFILSITSFTTLSSVAVVPNLWNLSPSCTTLSIVLLFEAFNGVVYGSICAALLFAKALSIERFAPLSFSSQCVVRPAPAGAEDNEEEDDEFSIADDSDGATVLLLPLSSPPSNPRRLPILPSSSNNHSSFPVFEFRVAHRRYFDDGSSLVGATMTASVALSVPQLRRAGWRIPAAPAAQVAPPCVSHVRYVPLVLELATHPLFSHSWYGRHELSQSSPLLTSAAKALIKQNGGLWPADLHLRGDLIRPFERILVAVTGRERRGNDVWSFHSYFMSDIRMNAAFLSMYVQDSFDLRRLDDVIEFEDSSFPEGNAAAVDPAATPANVGEDFTAASFSSSCDANKLGVGGRSFSGVFMGRG